MKFGLVCGEKFLKFSQPSFVDFSYNNAGLPPAYGCHYEKCVTQLLVRKSPMVSCSFSAMQ